MIRYTIGLSPREAASAAKTARLDVGDGSTSEDGLQAVRALVEKVKAACQSDGADVVAIGPIGLDYRGVEADEEAQREALGLQLELAQELGLPVVLKIRPEVRYAEGCARAERDAAAALLSAEKARKATAEALPVFLSAFCGRPSTLPKLLASFPRVRFGCDAMRCDAMRCDAMRCDTMPVRSVLMPPPQNAQMVVSFNGALTYRSSQAKDESGEGAQSLRDVCFDVPLDRLLLESGAPECRPRAEAAGRDTDGGAQGTEGSEDASYDPRLDDAAFRAEASALFTDKGGKAGKGVEVPALPRHVPLVAGVIARERAALGVTLATVLDAGRRNAARVFGVPQWADEGGGGGVGVVRATAAEGKAAAQQGAKGAIAGAGAAAAAAAAAGAAAAGAGAGAAAGAAESSTK